MSSYINPKYYDIIQSPLLTEKTANMSMDGYSCFLVQPEATKPEIKAAIEAIYKVEVATVRVVNYKPQVFRRYQRKRGMFKAYKKAFVKLKNGEVINFENAS